MTPPAGILWPILAHAALVFGLYAWLSALRLRAVRTGDATFATFEFGRDEPASIARVTRNLANQFELPVFFYAAILLLIAFGRLGTLDVALAWLFVAGRLIHTAVQTRTADVRLRGRVFVINAVAVAGLFAHLAAIAAGL